MDKMQCFACGADRKVEDFRYVIKDQGLAGSTYYTCDTECLLALAKAEREFSRDYDHQKNG